MATKPKIVRVYLDEDAQECLRQIVSTSIDLSEQQAASLMMKAAMRAIRANSFRIALPLVFKVSDTCLPPTATVESRIALNP